MAVANITPQMMFDRAEHANRSEELAGRTDAVIHFGWLVTGTKTPEEVDEIQTGNLDPATSNRRYRLGYTFMWSEMYALMF